MPLAKQVILFVIDGLRPDALQRTHTPQIDEFVARGSYTWRAQAVTPSVTLPCHASLFFAVPPARHGVVSYVWTRPQPPVLSLIELVHQAGRGQGFDHDAGLAEDLTIPWIISGLGIRRSHQISSAVNIIDTAPTIVYLLELPAPAEWSGRVVTEVLAS